MRSLLANLNSSYFTLLAALAARSLPQQQSAAIMLGQIDYSTMNSLSVGAVVDRLVTFCGSAVSYQMFQVQYRTNDCKFRLANELAVLKGSGMG